MDTPRLGYDHIREYLGQKAERLLYFKNPKIPKSELVLPGPDFVDRVFAFSDRNPQVVRNIAAIYNHGRLGGTGYLSILPVDQGVEHPTAQTFAINPVYYDPAKIFELAIEGGCNAVATTAGNAASVARHYAHRIPVIVKLNHSEVLTLPPRDEQTYFASARDAWNMGAAAIGITVYFGNPKSREMIAQAKDVIHEAHDLGMAAVVWCYLRNNDMKAAFGKYEAASDLTGYGIHQGVTLMADLIKQKQAETDNGFEKALPDVFKKFKKLEVHYEKRTSPHEIDLNRVHVLHALGGRVGVVHSGGDSEGETDLASIIQTAVVNKRAGGHGVITGRKAFQRPFGEGVELLHAGQDVYLNDLVTIA